MTTVSPTLFEYNVFTLATLKTVVLRVVHV